MTERSLSPTAMSRSPGRTRPLRVAILGSGKIGTDLLMKVRRSDRLSCTAMIGRTTRSDGLDRARACGTKTSDEGIGYIRDNPDCCDLVFDATSASDHGIHLPILQKLGKITIDLTPARLGQMCVPAINSTECTNYSSVNMVTCGGQAAIPIAYAIATSQEHVSYLEVVSSVASPSAGPATRVNLDEYIHTTEAGLRHFTGISDCKTMLNLNPAMPFIDMQMTIFATVENPDLGALTRVLQPLLRRVAHYTPGYELVVGPLVDGGRLVVTVRVRGLGDYLPAYAGNLDIINCAAVATAERYAERNDVGRDVPTGYREES